MKMCKILGKLLGWLIKLPILLGVELLLIVLAILFATLGVVLTVLGVILTPVGVGLLILPVGLIFLWAALKIAVKGTFKVAIEAL
jgi:hypothetical protein